MSWRYPVKDLAEQVKAKADELAGNWQHFDSFAPGSHLGNLAHGNQWALVYTTNRDADYITRSNHEIMTRELAPFLRHGRDIEEAGSNHWACGTVDGFLVRVYTPCGRMTRAFQALATMLVAIEDYPMLDENHASEHEREEADAVWKGCFSVRERIEWIRKGRFAWHDFADLLNCVRGKYAPNDECDGYHGLVTYG